MSVGGQLTADILQSSDLRCGSDLYAWRARRDSSGVGLTALGELACRPGERECHRQVVLLQFYAPYATEMVPVKRGKVWCGRKYQDG